jgi:hypothetical protein
MPDAVCGGRPTSCRGLLLYRRRLGYGGTIGYGDSRHPGSEGEDERVFEADVHFAEQEARCARTHTHTPPSPGAIVRYTIYTTLCIPAVSDLEGVVCVCVCVCVRVP